jgi:hypothetical protein
MTAVITCTDRSKRRALVVTCRQPDAESHPDDLTGLGVVQCDANRALALAAARRARRRRYRTTTAAMRITAAMKIAVAVVV